MNIAEILIEWKRPEMKDIVDVPRDLTDYNFDQKSLTRFLQSDPRRGPHAFRELNLMLKGLKPAALIDPIDLPKFQPYIPDKFSIAATWQRDTGTEYFVTLKGEEWRGRQLKKIWPRLRVANQRGDQEAVKKIHAQIGMLLGYPKDAIRFFIDPKNKITIR